MINMKSIRLAVLASALLWVLVGAGSAMGASNFCRAQQSPCLEPNLWATGTTLDFTIKSGTVVKMASTEGETLEECTGSALKGKMEKSEPVTGPIESLTWGGCNFPTTTTGLGKLEVDNAATAHNGTVKADGESKFTINGGFFGSCVYGLSSGTDLGELKEGKPATLVVNAVANKLSGSATACPETAKWTAEYTLAEPSEKTLSVESGKKAATGAAFCTVQESPCSEANRWAAGTTLDFTLKAGSTVFVEDTEANGVHTCSGSTLKAKVDKALPATVSIESLTWSSCFAPTTTTLLGRLEVESILEGHNGTVKADTETKVTFNSGLFGDCIYGFTAGTDLGELKEGKPATLVVNAVGEKLTGSAVPCPGSTKWRAEYSLTEPKEKTLSVELT